MDLKIERRVIAINRTYTNMGGPFNCSIKSIIMIKLIIICQRTPSDFYYRPYDSRLTFD